MGCGALVPVKAVNGGHRPRERDPDKVMKGEYTQLQEARLVREKSMRDRRIKILQAADEKAEKALEEREHLSLGNRSRGTSRTTSRTTSPTGKKKQVLFKPSDEKMKPVEEKYTSQESLRIEDTKSKEKKNDKSSLRKTNSFKEQVIDSKMEPDFSEINSISSPRKDMPKNFIPNGLSISGTNSSLQQKESNANVKGVTDSSSRALTQTQNSDILQKEIDISQNDSENKSHESKGKKKKKSHSKDADDNVGESIAAGPSGVDNLEKGSENHKHRKKRKKKKEKGREEMIDDSVENEIQTVARNEDRAHSRSSVRSDASSKRG